MSLVSRGSHLLVFWVAALLALAACAGAAGLPVTGGASVTQEVGGDGRLDLVFVNRGAESLGLQLRKLELASETSTQCKAAIERLESAPGRSAIKMLGERYTSFTPPRGWMHRQLRIPASMMDVGCVLRIVAYAGSEDIERWLIEPALSVPLRAGYSTALDLPVTQGSSPAATAYSEYNVAEKNHVVHVLYKFSADAKGSQEVIANASARCEKGTMLTLSPANSDRKLQEQNVLVGAGQWSGLALSAKGALPADGCAVTTKLVRRSADANPQTPVAEVTVKQELTREREFLPDRPIP